MRIAFAKLAFALLIAAALLGQDTTFRAETKLVIVNVAVKDKNGNPVMNLAKDDFRIFEDNVPQTISVFDLQKLNSEPLAPISFSQRPQTLEQRSNPAQPAMGASVNTPAVRDPKRFQDRRLLALFFDLTSMQPEEQVRSQRAAVKFLQTQVTSADLVAIMTFSTKFRVVQDFTDDRETLLSTLQKMSLGETSDLSGLAATAGDENDDSGSFTADDTEFNIFNTDRKLIALEDAARKLAAYPQKKALIYFSGGVNKTGVDNQSQLKATVNAAIRANVSFYPIDARGLTALPPGGDASTASPRGTGILSGTKQQGIRDTFNDSQETLSTLAADTGGKALLDSNDLTTGIRQAQQDINSYYTLGFYSSNAVEDGKYRRIKVELVNKTLNAKLDYRNGYYASKTFQKSSDSDKERQLQEALTLGDPVSELPLALEVDYFRVARDRYFVPISVKIPGSAVGLSKKGQAQTTNLDFIGQVRDSGGKLVSGVRDQISVKLNDADAARIGQRNLQYDTGLTLAPGSYDLVFLARENMDGKMGTFETRFVVPDLNSGRNLRVSSVILSSQKEAVTSAVGAADNNKKLQSIHPLVQDGQKMVPSITRVFRKDQTLFVYFEVYDPAVDPDRKFANLTAAVELLSGARKAYTSQPVRVNRTATARPGVAAFNFQVPLERLAPGEYISQVDVIDELGRKFAFPRNSMVVLP